MRDDGVGERDKTGVKVEQRQSRLAALLLRRLLPSLGVSSVLLGGCGGSTTVDSVGDQTKGVGGAGAAGEGGGVDVGGQGQTAGAGGVGDVGGQGAGGTVGAAGAGDVGGMGATECVIGGPCVDSEYCAQYLRQFLGKTDDLLCACASDTSQGFQCPATGSTLHQPPVRACYVGDECVPFDGAAGAPALAANEAAIRGDLAPRWSPGCGSVASIVSGPTVLTSSAGQECCYAVNLVDCTGRPLMIDKVQKIAAVAKRSDWA